MDPEYPFGSFNLEWQNRRLISIKPLSSITLSPVKDPFLLNIFFEEYCLLSEQNVLLLFSPKNLISN